MKYIEGSLENVYGELINSLMMTPIVGQTHEIRNCILEIHKPTLENFSFPYRHISEKYSNEELKWYWSGDNRCESIGQFAKLWLSLTDDGVTNNSAYGYILFKKYGFDQLQQIVELLKKDPESRRAVLNISDPAINRITTKDMQCTIALQFLIRNGKLEETVYMRSNDVFFGFPYDYIFFVSIGKYIAEKLGIELSLYTHNVTSIHMYLRDIEKFKTHEQKLNIDYRKVINEYYEK